MRLARPLALVVALVVVLAACAAERPGWTFAPTPTPTAAPASEPPASGVPTAAPTDDGTGATVLRISAVNVAFDTDALAAPAGVAFQIEFANSDAGIPHNVEILQNGQSVWKGELFSGVETRTYDVPALAAGTYDFICTVHPTMKGILTVG